MAYQNRDSVQGASAIFYLGVTPQAGGVTGPRVAASERAGLRGWSAPHSGRTPLFALGPGLGNSSEARFQTSCVRTLFTHQTSRG